MQIPIRCFTCGKPIAQYWDEYNKRVNAGEDPKKIMDDLGLERYCCRSIFLSHIDLVKKVGVFKK
jgi:DNA-directed RNA polymerase subunit N